MGQDALLKVLTQEVQGVPNQHPSKQRNYVEADHHVL